jgi:prepilin-type N-terminal cleavage/methylation domain-containing protein
MRSFLKMRSDSRYGQRGFSLIEVMFASMILSVIILGVGGFWYAASSRVADLVLKQKAIYVLNAEVERLTALYVFTGLATHATDNPVTTTGYDGVGPFTRLVYPSDLTTFMGAGNNFVTTSANTFATGSEFLIWDNLGFLSALNRMYVWIDKSRNIVGRLSWVDTPINIGSCIQAADCSCQRFDNQDLTGGRCRRLDIYLEYPYRFAISGTVTAPAQLQTISIKTIAGRG